MFNTLAIRTRITVCVNSLITEAWKWLPDTCTRQMSGEVTDRPLSDIDCRDVVVDIDSTVCHLSVSTHQHEYLRFVGGSRGRACVFCFEQPECLFSLNYKIQLLPEHDI